MYMLIHTFHPAQCYTLISGPTHTHTHTSEVGVVGGVDEVVTDRLGQVVRAIQVLQVENVVLLAHKVVQHSLGGQAV